MTSTPLPPTSLGDDYTINREIGRGGMAAVYGAHDRRHNRGVAIKVLDSDVAASLGTARFLKEIATIAALSHPNIVPVYDSGEQDGVLYYVMPHIEGKTLRQVIKRKERIPLAEVVRITRRVAAALDFAHHRGVVHRDIKPENIILFEGEPLILDFGIAKALTAAGGGTLTATGIAVGTPAYLSPEQATGEKGLDGRSDEYSLACVVYELVAGSPPFTAASAQGTIAKRFTEKPRGLAAVAAGTPRRFSDAVAKALSLESDDQFPTASEFAEELGQSLHETEDSRQPHDELPSLAVLPFTNVSPDPSLAESHAAHRLVLTYQSRFEEAESEFKQAIALDPVSFDAAYHYARMLATAGRVERAAEMFEAAADLRPEDYQALCLAINPYSAAGRADDAHRVAMRAIESCEHALAINPGDSRALGLGAAAFQYIGDMAKARDWVQRALQIDPRNAMVAFNTACFESIAGNTEAALDMLERAVDLGFRNTTWLQHDPDMNHIREHPRFKEVLRRTEAGRSR